MSFYNLVKTQKTGIGSEAALLCYDFTVSRGTASILGVDITKTKTYGDNAMAFDFKSIDFSKIKTREFNVGTSDQKIRLGVGVALLFIASAMESGLLMLLGLMVVVTGALKWCPAYSVIAKSTVQDGDKPPVI